ncbi:MAG: hypothetical protein MUF66_02495 [Gammaproteobacteria bacterium]|nr:hypothetical protein [Gammaproteobacteria bacterium]
MTLGLDAPGAAERFVRGTLGCGCADEVFRRVRVDRDPAVGRHRLAWRIDVGGRLLVYVLEPPGPAELDATLGELTRAGRAERDASGFNRLRVVVAAADPAPLEDPAHTLFEGSGAVDDRVHLHVIGFAPRAEAAGCA